MTDHAQDAPQPAAWMVVRDEDRTFPRFYRTQSGADAMVESVTAYPPAEVRPLYASPVTEGNRASPLEVTEDMLKAGAQALADDVWHPPQKFSSLPPHDQNKFTRQALLVLKAATALPSTDRGGLAK